MPKDIRSFFQVINSSKTDKPAKSDDPPKAKKRKPVVIESSDEKTSKKTENAKKKETKKRKIVNSISDSDSDAGNSPKKAKASKNKVTPKDKEKNLKPISAEEMFGSKKPPKKEDKPIENETDVFSDEDFKETLKQVDEELSKSFGLKTNSETTNKSKDTKTHSPQKRSPEKKSSNDVQAESSKTPNKTNSLSSDEVAGTPQSENSKSKRKRKLSEGLDETITDEDRHERRQQSAILYRKYLQRGGPPKPGSKEVPKGKPDCLKGLTFIITGVLESLERDEAASIITELGGRVTKTVSGKVTYMVVGDDAGPAKTEKAKSLGIKMISEDELLDLIRIKSGLPPKNSSGALVVEGEESKEENKKGKTTKKVASKKKEADGETQKKTEKTKVSPKKESEFIKQSKNGSQNVDMEETSPFFGKKPKTDPEPSVNDENTKSVENKSAKRKDTTSNKKTKTTEEIKTPPKQIEKPEPTEIDPENIAWVDKYKPKTIKNIIGQQGEKSNMRKLMFWLENWYKNRDPNKKIPKPSPWAKDDTGAYYKAALLSGPPGVGKTTTATLVCKELGYDIVEMNASDTRNKKLLHDDVGHLLSNKSLAGFVTDQQAPTKKHVLLMDEVDGMAGNEDRGGVQELIMLIKKTSVPIICMCNDRNHPKIRSLANYCFDLRFSKPRLEQIRAAMMSVCFKEGIKIKPEVLDQVIIGTQHDIRQTLNNLAMWVQGNHTLDVDEAKKKANNAKKDIKLGPWDVVRKVFSSEEQKKMSIHDKSDLFFHDYSIAPLFVQENYLSVTPHADKKQWLHRVAETADSLSIGDLTDSRIRGAGAWSLLPLQAMYSSVIPGHLLSGHFSSQINFPAWLGKNSKRNKFQRLLNELQIHMRLSISGSQEAVNLDCLKYVRDAIINPLSAGDITEAVKVMQTYHLLREDLDSLVELSLWPRQKDPMALINGQVKASFTRLYNKECNLVPYTVTKTKIPTTTEETDELEAETLEAGDEDEENEDNDDDITHDAMIKVKKNAKKPVAGTSKEATSSKKTKDDSKQNRKEKKKAK